MWDGCCGIIHCMWFHTFSQNAKVGEFKPEFPPVLIFKGPWNPQFEDVGALFAFRGSFAYLLKFAELFSCIPMTHFAKKTVHPFHFLCV